MAIIKAPSLLFYLGIGDIVTMMCTMSATMDESIEYKL